MLDESQSQAILIEPRWGARLQARFRALSLSTKLLLLTIGFVMLAEVLIFAPSVANYRHNWLLDRLTAAQIASLALEAAPDRTLPRKLRSELLNTAGVRAVALRRDDFRELVLQLEDQRSIDATYDLREATWVSLIGDGLGVFFAPDGRMIRVIGSPEIGGDLIEIVMDEAPLKAALMTYATNIFFLSLIISFITAALVYLALNALFVRPVERLTWNMVRFRENPEDRSRIISPCGRGDELGTAEHELAAMQSDLADMLQQKSRLAALGLAVSKINHDLRNILASAQLMSDRMVVSTDPIVQRFAPKLILSLDRAIQLCAETLRFGKASELPPRRKIFPLAPLIEEAADSIGLPDHPQIAWRMAVPPNLQIDADRDQLFRIFSNLLRNAAQILEKTPTDGAAPAIEVGAQRDGGVVRITVSDNGPGVPIRARPHLFEPFKGSSRDGGTGLGLAISAEIARAHGGALSLLDTETGASFRLEIPDAQTAPSGRPFAIRPPKSDGARLQ
ncbi:MAG: HAMP domain-containing sensor histidine kinase [Hyphomicrobiales bacterium]|nr:HAMP domain-containing sensor histidine kinase [Hyphomicrobiales bacterium]